LEENIEHVDVCLDEKPAEEHQPGWRSAPPDEQSVGGNLSAEATEREASSLSVTVAREVWS
jgi:hypothetical protein